MKKTVVIVEDDSRLRGQLIKTLELAQDITCLGAYASAEAALPEILNKQPDVVLMDIKLPGMTGIECVLEIKKTFPQMQVIMVTNYEESERIFHALKAGASGYIIKSDSPDQLPGAIRDVFKGGSPMSSSIARKVVHHFHLIGVSPKEAENLSPREREVIELLAQGFIYKEISEKLDIGVTTVRTLITEFNRYGFPFASRTKSAKPSRSKSPRSCRVICGTN